MATSSCSSSMKRVEIRISAAVLAMSVASVVVAVVTLIIMPKQEVIATQNKNLLQAVSAQTRVMASVGRHLQSIQPPLLVQPGM